MSGITRPVAGAARRPTTRHTPPVVAQVALTVLAGLLTAAVVVATSTLVQRWA